MRIGIDARFFGPSGTGLGRYTQRLVENLEKIDHKNQYVVFLGKENFDEYKPKASNFKKVLADFRWYTIAEQIKMPSLLNKYNLDLVHFPHFNVPIFYRKKFIVTIHDLILVHFPTVKNTTRNRFLYWMKFLAYKLVIYSAIKRARKIIAVSNFTKNDILSNYGASSDKISVTYEAWDEFVSDGDRDEKIIIAKYGIIKPYLLYVGNAYPHKNLEKCVVAFEKILKKRKDLQLVLVGKDGYFYQRIREVVHAHNISNVIFAGFVPDENLGYVYRNAWLYVFPSLYEGFCLPSLEAMANGVAVASSDHPCMKEILGESADYFDASSSENIAQGLLEVLEDPLRKKELVKKGYEQVKKYSWEKMAMETLEIYEMQKQK